jgi:glutamate dehydrogenase
MATHHKTVTFAKSNNPSSASIASSNPTTPTSPTTPLESPMALDPLPDHLSDYADNEFEEKPEQMAKVVEFIESKGFLPSELIVHEVTWFYKYFFKFHPVSP